MPVTPTFYLCSVKPKISNLKNNSIMKKLAIILVIAAMVVLDLILSGMNVILGLLLIVGAGIFAYVMDQSSRQPRKTTSITRAARRSREQQKTIQNADLSVAA